MRAGRKDGQPGRWQRLAHIPHNASAQIPKELERVVKRSDISVHANHQNGCLDLLDLVGPAELVVLKLYQFLDEGRIAVGLRCKIPVWAIGSAMNISTDMVSLRALVQDATRRSRRLPRQLQDARPWQGDEWPTRERRDDAALATGGGTGIVDAGTIQQTVHGGRRGTTQLEFHLATRVSDLGCVVAGDVGGTVPHVPHIYAVALDIISIDRQQTGADK